MEEGLRNGSQLVVQQRYYNHTPVMTFGIVVVICIRDGLSIEREMHRNIPHEILICYGYFSRRYDAL